MFPPIIGYNNRLEEGTVAGDGTDKQNAYDWFTHDAWITGAGSGYLEVTLASPAPVDYLAVARHTIFTQGGAVKLQHDPGGGYVDLPNSIYTPPDDSPFMVIFDAVTSTKFKLVVSGLAAAAELAVVSFGARLQLERGAQAGFTSPMWGRRDTIRPATSEGGEMIGRSLIRTGSSGQLALAHLTESWLRAYFDPFVQHAREKPWFFLWNGQDYPTEVALLQTTSTPRPEYEDRGRQSVTISYEGIAE